MFISFLIGLFMGTIGGFLCFIWYSYYMTPADIRELREVLLEWYKWYKEIPPYQTRVKLEEMTNKILEKRPYAKSMDYRRQRRLSQEISKTR